MDLTGKEATVLTILSRLPNTRFYERLLVKLDRPEVRAIAERIRNQGLDKRRMP